MLKTVYIVSRWYSLGGDDGYYISERVFFEKKKAEALCELDHERTIFESTIE